MKIITIAFMAIIGLANCSAEAALVNVRLNGTITSGGTFGVDFTGRTISVGFQYDSARTGSNGIFLFGANALNPFIDINGARYVNFADQLAPATPRTITVADATPDTFALTYGVNGYVGITDTNETLKINFAGASELWSSVDSLPSSLNAGGIGTGSFSVFYADDCLNYACGPVLPFYASATFNFTALTASVMPSVPVPAPIWLLGTGLLTLGVRKCRLAVRNGQ